MMNKAISVFLLIMLSGCACALDDEDRAKGKPHIAACVAASLLKANACKTNRTDPEQCPR